MATTTIQTVSMMSAGKSSSSYRTKSESLEGSLSFQNFFLKSSQSEKIVQPKAEKTADKGVEEAVPAMDKKADGKVNENTDKKNLSDTKATEANPPKNNTKLSEREEAKLKEFIENVQKTLGLDADEMQMWLNVTGMQVPDLLQPANLQHFFLQVSGIDVSQLLTDRSQTEKLKDLMSVVGELEPMLQRSQSKEVQSSFNAVMKEMLSEAETPMEIDQEHLKSYVGDTAINESIIGRQDSTNIFEEAPKTKDQQQMELLKEAISVFHKVVVNEEQVRITSDGLEKMITTVSAKDIFEQVVTRFTAQAGDGTSKLTLQLNPQHLGKIAFQVVSREGQVTGQFVAESEAVKSALEAQVSQLKLHLANQGIRVEDVKVLVGDTANYFADDKSKEHHQESGKKRTKRLHDGLSMNAVTEETGEEEINISTGTIDFTA